MASIQKTKFGTWRAQVFHKGYRYGATFKTQEGAQQWAQQKEEQVIRREAGREQRVGTMLLSNIPKRVLTAIEDCPFKADEVLEGCLAWPMQSGIYFLIRDEEIKYVGKSVNVFRRLSQHCENGYRFDRFNVVFAPPEQLDALEETYISAMLPPWNEHVGLHKEKRTRSPEETASLDS